ncbi:MAG TPA: pyridoxamine 5'-phosphate oxidase family protein [Burkholderiales bacterium]|nr:pyridoxamine 5'-phosphate oxidase family protein [Burkholderiales bacterium]
MGKTYQEVSDDLAAWVRSQPLFFVGTAPLRGDGHVNISPKGLDTLRILDANRVAYLDLTGSGAETIAHVRENGRIVLMFCAFSGPPKIVRFHGKARIVTPRAPDWAALRGRFAPHLGARAVIDVAVTRISDSCGYGVPSFGEAKQREALDMWTDKRGAAGLVEYRAQKNARSIDGLPAFAPQDEEPR